MNSLKNAKNIRKMDRLYIVDTETNEYLCFAKGLLNGWILGNIDLYKDFIKYRNNFIIGTEEDEKFFNKWILNGVNFNVDNKWVI